MPDQTSQETLKSPVIPSKVQEIQKIQQEKADYYSAFQGWQQDSVIRQKGGLEPNPQPPEPESLLIAKTLDQIQYDTYEAGMQSMMDIRDGANPELNLLGRTLTEEIKQKAAEKLHLGQENLETLITEVGNYSGSVDPEMVTIVRASALINAFIQSSSPQVEELVARVVTDHPEALHLTGGYPAGYVDNIRQGYAPINDRYGNPQKETILKALAAETSPLSPPEREQAKFYLNESVGFRFFTGIHDISKADTININTLSDILGVKFTIDQWNQVKDNRNHFTVDQIPPTLATLSHNESISPEDRKKLQAEVVGCIKAMEVTSNKMVNTIGNGYDARRESRPEALTRKKAAAQTMLNLIDKGNVRIFTILQTTDTDPVNRELRKIYNDKYLHFQTPEATNVLYAQNTEVLNKEDKIREAQYNEERLQRKKEEDEKITAEKIKSAAETKQSVEAFGSPLVQDLLRQINYSQLYPTESIRQKLFEDKPLLGDFKYSFVSAVLDNIDKLRPNQIGIVFSAERVIQEARAGVFGIGKRDEIREPYFASDHTELNRRLLVLKDKHKPGEILSREDEALRLAMENYLKLPNKES